MYTIITGFEAIATLFDELIFVAPIFGLGGDGQKPAPVMMKPSPQRSFKVGAETDVCLQSCCSINHASVNIRCCLVKLLPSIFFYMYTIYNL